MGDICEQTGDFCGVQSRPGWQGEWMRLLEADLNPIGDWAVSVSAQSTAQHHHQLKRVKLARPDAKMHLGSRQGCEILQSAGGVKEISRYITL